MTDRELQVTVIATATNESIADRLVYLLRDSRRISPWFERKTSIVFVSIFREAEARRAEWSEYGRKLAAVLVNDGKALRWLGED